MTCEASFRSISNAASSTSTRSCRRAQQLSQTLAGSCFPRRLAWEQSAEVAESIWAWEAYTCALNSRRTRALSSSTPLTAFETGTAGAAGGRLGLSPIGETRSADLQTGQALRFAA